MIDKYGSLITKYRNKKSESIMKIASERFIDWDFIRYLLKNGGNANEKARDGRTVLQRAVESSGEDISLINYLIECGADINLKDEHSVVCVDSVVKLAANLGKWNIVRELIINHGYKISGNDHSILYNSIGNIENLEFLVSNGADMNFKINIEYFVENKNLLFALLNNWRFDVIDSIGTLKWMIEKQNISIHSKDDDENSVLHTAIYCFPKWREVLDYLISKGKKS